MSPILIDTNVLVYAYDSNQAFRQHQALEVVRRLKQAASGRLSVQCLSEFFNVSTRRLRPPLTAAEALEGTELMARSFSIIDLTTPIVLEAGRGVRDHQLAYYDAQLWATAKLHQIPVIFSEDFSDGRIIEGVRFVNPFAADFVLESWI